MACCAGGKNCRVARSSTALLIPVRSGAEAPILLTDARPLWRVAKPSGQERGEHGRGGDAEFS
jgi:hypothetical protein